jgi:hypothetical protein
MHYLKCTKCGFLNDVKGEYLIFCQKCNKKLENNYRDWQKRNPDKTLDDFKSLICISDEEIKSEPIVKQTIPKSAKILIFFIVGFVLFILTASIVGKVFGPKFFDSINPNSNTIMDQKWITEHYGQDGLIVETPFKLNTVELPYSEEVKAFMENHFGYSIQTKNLLITICSIKYKPVIGEANLQGAANGSIAEMKMQPGVSDFEYSEDSTKINDIRGIKLTGTFILKNIKYSFVNVIYSKGLNLYQAMVGFPSEEKVGEKIAERLINSIRIEKK